MDRWCARGDVATLGGEALLSAAERTDAGLDWGMRRGSPSRMPNFSHGTAGIASALAVAGVALDREDFVAAAVQGARHLVAVGSLTDDGFVVPHTIPSSAREVEPVTYTWCHGPTGNRGCPARSWAASSSASPTPAVPQHRPAPP